MLVFRPAPRRAALAMGDEKEDEQFIRDQFIGWSESLRKDLTPHVEHAIATGSASALLDDAGWNTAWNAVGDDWADGTRQMLVTSGEREIEKLGFDFAFTVENPYATAWARNFAGQRITQISDQTRAAIRSVIHEGFVSHVPPRELAPLIRETIGLTDRSAQAVVNRALKLLGDDVPIEKVQADAARYAKRLLNQRALSIATTEVNTAQNKGLQASWQTARDKGFLKHGTKRMWIASLGSEGICEVCEDFGAPENRLTGLDEPFHSSDHGDSMGPSAHTRCECTQGLVQG